MIFCVLEMQLSSDYIERYLGKLNMIQESKLIQLRQSMKELRGSSVPSDATLLRFLRATEFSVDKAKEMLTQALHWRKKHQIDRLLEEYQVPHVIKDYFPGGWHHFDKGIPMIIDIFTNTKIVDISSFFKNTENILTCTMHVLIFRRSTFVYFENGSNGCERIIKIHRRR